MKQKDRGLPFRTFDYSPAVVYSPEVAGTDWYLLSAYDMIGDHIRIHELKEGDDLIGCVEGYQSNHAKAVIVVNNTEDSVLPREVALPLQKLGQFLVGVLPFSAGNSLLECLQVQFEDDELYARCVAAFGIRRGSPGCSWLWLCL